MKAADCHRFGGPEVLSIEEWPKPAPKAGEVLVRVRAAGLNRADLNRDRVKEALRLDCVATGALPSYLTLIARVVISRNQAVISAA